MRKCIFIFFLLSCAYGLAQFSDSIHYHANYTSTGSYNRTNTNRTYLINNTFNLNYRKKPFQVNFSNKWLYGLAQFSDSIHYHANYTSNKRPCFY